MDNVKEIPELSPSSQLSRQYILAFGSVAHYIKQVEQYHESHQTTDPLPPRWLHLAERSLMHRPILKYQQYFSATDFLHPKYTPEALHRIQLLDNQVHSINSLL